MARAEFTLPADWDRCEEQRWRIYVLRGGADDPVCLFSVGSLAEIGPSLAYVEGEGQYEPERHPVGILDGIEGHWLVNPFTTRPTRV